MVSQICKHLGPSRRRALKRATARHERREVRRALAQGEEDIASRRAFHGWGC
jgi:hypothetical protein